MSRDDAYQYLNKFIVAEVTTTIRGIPVEVLLGPQEGLKQRYVVNCDNLRTVARSWLIRQAGVLRSDRHWEVKRAIGFAFCWDELMHLRLD